MKNVLYLVKKWIEMVFCYPVCRFNVAESSGDYDVYWKDKRGTNIGNLSSWQKDRASFILSIIGKNGQEPIELVDVGCGDGSILNYLKNNALYIRKCTGYDSSLYAIEQAKKFNIDAIQADVSRADSYDIFVEADYYLLLETLEHIPQSEALLQKAVSKSRKGVFFSFPNTGYLNHRLRLLFGKFPLQWRIHPNEHVRFWTHADLRWWLKAQGIGGHKIHCYKGIPMLNLLFPSLFAAAFIVFIEKR